MVYSKLKKIFAVSLSAAMAVTAMPSVDFYANAASNEKEASMVALSEQTEIGMNDDGVFHVTVDENGKINADVTYDPEGEYAADTNTAFTWDNVNTYFVITDRFYNGDTSNDHSYGRSANSSNISRIKDTSNKEDAATTFSSIAGSYASKGDGSAQKYTTGSEKDGYLSNNSVGTFHGGDLKGLTEHVKNGYFDALGTNAIWLTAPYEQVHGAVCSSGFKHYAYHGYYALDYTEVDANMGTAEELREFIDTAHEHGIRIVFDVVMNHSGYPDGYTIAEYYGANSDLLSSNWRDIYFGKSESELQWYMDYANEESSGGNGIIKYGNAWNSSWFTSAWQRMVKNRYGSEYTEGEGASLTLCSTGLPDFKTESGTQLDIPSILSKKWTAEGRLSEKTKETQNMLSACGYGSKATVKQYLVAWLSNWVREYGVDGFRCDTAKHVDISCWSELKTQCNKALNEWRKNNSDKECSKWTNDFWMTGEVYDQGLSMNGGGTDYTQGFDSLINFSFKGKESTSGSNLESIFNEYANYARSSEKGDPLSYISSHDKGIGARSANAGTALLLLPGGVQTYYGDETGRQGGSDEQSWRSNMNWSSMNTGILSNWQKVGRFRRNHVSVGAGKHAKISDSPYTFSRTYKGTASVGGTKDTAYEDKVVVSLPGSKGTYDISVKGVFDDGDVITDEYSGETYTVSGGKVSVTCDANGVILLGIPAETKEKAKVSATVSDGKVEDGSYSSDTITVSIATENVKDASVQINDGKEVSFKDATKVTFGNDTDYEEETIITVKGTSALEDGEAITKTFTYKRSAEPKIGVAATGLYCRVKKSDFSEIPYIHVYDDSTNYTGKWKTTTMKEAGDYYIYEDEKITGQVYIIIFLGDESYRSTADMKNPNLVSGAVELVKGTTENGSFKEVQLDSGKKPGTVKIEFVDQDGKNLKTISRVGEIGEKYSFAVPEELTKPAGYVLVDGEEKEISGSFAEKEETFTVKMRRDDEPVATATPTIAPTATVAATATPTIAPTATVAPATATPTVAPTETPEPLEVLITNVSPKKNYYKGAKIKFTAGVTGVNNGCKYQYVVENTKGVQLVKRAYSNEATFTWTPKSTGNYIVHIYARDKVTAEIAENSFQLTVSKAPKLVVKTFSVSRVKKLLYKLSASASAGTKQGYKYRFTCTYKGSTKVLKNYNSTKVKSVKFKKAGTYKFTVSIKDCSGQIVSRTKTVKVK